MVNGNEDIPVEAGVELVASHEGVEMGRLDTNEPPIHDDESFVEAKREWAAINQC